MPTASGLGWRVWVVVVLIVAILCGLLRYLMDAHWPSDRNPELRPALSGLASRGPR